VPPPARETVPAPAREPAPPAPRGLRGLLRRQTSLPLGDRPTTSNGEGSDRSREEREGTLPLGERREGVFEIRAGERPPEPPR